MASDSTPLQFVSSEENKSKQNKPAWKILIVDDDLDTHKSSHLILKGLQFDNKKIQTYDAYSGLEAREMIKSVSGISVILLDVIMETDQAGLEFIDHIKNYHQYRSVPIILRTGQPGLVSKEEIYRNYAIYSYLDKSQLSASTLKETIFSAIQTYQTAT